MRSSCPGSRCIRSISMFLAACFATCLAHVDARELRPPNILVIVSDNQGWKDIGYNGSEIRTPTLDRLADEGIRLDHFYVYPMCSPTRAAFVAGRAPSRFNINGAIGNRSRQSLPVDTVTIADALRAVGYRTAITGKWHLGLRPEVGPLQYGFDSSYGYLHGQIDKLSHHYKNGDRSWHRDDRFLDEVGHSVDLITDEAIRVIGKKHDAAFFLYVPYGAPHPPLQEEERWTSIYDGTIESLSRREYAAAVTHMDHSIGRLIDALNQTGQRDDTLVVFFSDNGAIENWPPQPKNYAGRFGPYPVLGNNGHLRGWIGELYDGCVRTPAFVNWPGQLKPAVLDDVVSVLDLYPTIVSLAGGAIDDELQLDANRGTLRYEQRPRRKIQHCGTAPRRRAPIAADTGWNGGS
jgi:arylsulfatase B